MFFKVRDRLARELDPGRSAVADGGDRCSGAGVRSDPRALISKLQKPGLNGDQIGGSGEHFSASSQGPATRLIEFRLTDFLNY